jgi:hypothetical protein
MAKKPAAAAAKTATEAAPTIPPAEGNAGLSHAAGAEASPTEAPAVSKDAAYAIVHYVQPKKDASALVSAKGPEPIKPEAVCSKHLAEVTAAAADGKGPAISLAERVVRKAHLKKGAPKQLPVACARCK